MPTTRSAGEPAAPGPPPGPGGTATGPPGRMARLRSTAREVEDAWLGGAPTPVGRAAVRGGFALLFALGVLHWGLVFEGGDLPLTDYDWSKESLYYSVWQQALTRGAVPYYVAPPVLDTDQFLAIPETNISPQILLLL